MNKIAVCAGVLALVSASMMSCNDAGTTPIPIVTTIDTANIVSKTELAQFLGVAPAAVQAKLVYVKASATGMNPFFIDFAEAVPQARKIYALSDVKAPLISPDGQNLVFFTGTESTPGAIYTCKLMENAIPVYVGAGYDPHWWVDPVGGGTYIIYCTVMGTSMNWPNPGSTYKQRIDPVTLAPAAGEAAVLLAPYSLNAGLSKNGRYLATSFQSTGIYDLQGSGAWKSVISVAQACNGSISPSADPALEGQMMYLTLGVTIGPTTYAQHKAIIISDTNTAAPKEITNIKKLFPLPLGVTEWQKPEWSTNYSFATALGLKDGEWGIYLLNTADETATLKVVGRTSLSEPNYEIYPHLWVP